MRQRPLHLVPVVLDVAVVVDRLEREAGLAEVHARLTELGDDEDLAGVAVEALAVSRGQVASVSEAALAGGLLAGWSATPPEQALSTCIVSLAFRAIVTRRRAAVQRHRRLVAGAG